MRTAVDQITALMGWPATGVETYITGSTPLLVLGEIDGNEHARRVAEGRLPVTDAFLLRCVCHEDPGFATRPSPVNARAIVAVRRRWNSAFEAIGAMAAFAPRIVAIPAPQARSDQVAVEAIATGIGVVATNAGAPWDLVHAPAPVRAPVRTWVHRWVEETMYNAFLAAVEHAPVGPVIKPRASP